MEKFNISWLAPIFYEKNILAFIKAKFLHNFFWHNLIMYNSI